MFSDLTMWSVYKTVHIGFAICEICMLSGGFWVYADGIFCPEFCQVDLFATTSVN